VQDPFKNFLQNVIRKHRLFILQAIILALILPSLAARMYEQSWQSSNPDYLWARAFYTALYGALTCFACVALNRNIALRCGVTAIVAIIFYRIWYYFPQILILAISIAVSLVTPSSGYSVIMKFALRIAKFILVLIMLGIVLRGDGGGDSISGAGMARISYGLVWLSVLYDGFVLYFRKYWIWNNRKVQDAQ
jgi:hypothetical protein